MSQPLPPVNVGVVPEIDAGDAAIVLPAEDKRQFAEAVLNHWNLVQRVYAEQIGPRLARLNTPGEPVYPVDIEMLNAFLQLSIRSIGFINLALASKNSIQRLQALLIRMQQQDQARMMQLQQQADGILQGAQKQGDTPKLVLAHR